MSDDPEFWITELEDIPNQMDEIGLMSQMSDDDFVLHIMGNIADRNAYLENNLMAESGEKAHH